MIQFTQNSSRIDIVDLVKFIQELTDKAKGKFNQKVGNHFEHFKAGVLGQMNIVVEFTQK